MAPIEAEVSTMKGDIIARKTVPEEPGDYSIADSTLTISKIIPGRKNGKDIIKAVRAAFGPPFSDGRTQQRFSFNGKPSEIIPPEAENTLPGGRHKARLRVVKK